ncbi:hypothetical protein N2152v2_004241 [Parachlorella kessleri]
MDIPAWRLCNAREKGSGSTAPAWQWKRRQHDPAVRHAAAPAAAAAGGGGGAGTGSVLEQLRDGGIPDYSSPKFKGDEKARRIEEAFEDLFWGATAAPRVLESFRRLQAGRVLIKDHPGLGRQHAESYIEGLSAEPFPDVHSGAYPWLEAVEAAAADIWQEFQQVTSDPEGLAARGNSIWVAAARDEALAYGPDWRTLVLQDRGVWEPVNSKLFPRTSKALKNANAPTLEVFFARQQAGTGIASHTDFVNFVQTSHLGLDIPDGDCWIKVGDHTRKWEHGKIICMSTDFMHETRNNTERDRVVLIMRHFHPEVTALERRAIQFLFDCLDNPSLEGVKAAARKAKELAAAAAVAAGARGGGGSKKGRKGKGFAPAGSGGRGFGKPAA